MQFSVFSWCFQTTFKDKAFAQFNHPEIAPITKLKSGLNIMELFHGKTWAFKDLALSCVGQFLEYFSSKQEKHLTIVVGKAKKIDLLSFYSIKNVSRSPQFCQSKESPR